MFTSKVNTNVKAKKTDQEALSVSLVFLAPKYKMILDIKANKYMENKHV